MSWGAFNESEGLISSVEGYKERTDKYPVAVQAGKIYRIRENLAYCKEHGIRLSEPSLGRLKKDQTVDKQTEYQDVCERNIVEGKFGEAKVAYGLERLCTKLKETNKAEIQMVLIVINLSRCVRDNFFTLFDGFFMRAVLLS